MRFLLAASACLTLGACSTTFNPRVVAVTAPDSISAGRPLDIKVHWVSTNGCASFYRFHSETRGETVLVLIPMARTTGRICTAVFLIPEAIHHVQRPPLRSFRVEVRAANGRFSLPVLVGFAASPIERHHITVLDDASGTPLAGAPISLLASWQDTLAAGLTQADGTFAASLPCREAGYQLDLRGSRSPGAPLTFANARCGVPERTVIRLQ